MTDAMQQMFAYGTATPPHCRDREETGVIRPGAHVRIVGLESRSDLNGTNGVVLDYSYQKARWAVRMQHEAVRVKPSNLRGWMDMFIGRTTQRPVQTVARALPTGAGLGRPPPATHARTHTHTTHAR